MAEEKKGYAVAVDKMVKILITGGNKGIGLALAKLLVEDANNQVIIGCRNLNQELLLDKENKLRKDPVKWELGDLGEEKMTRLEVLQKKFEKFKNIDFVEIDLVNPENIKKAADTIREKYANINILVNNAGMAWPKPDEFNLDIVNKTFDVNYYGTARVTDALLDIMKSYNSEHENKTQQPKIINVCSQAGILNKRIKDPQEQKAILGSQNHENLDKVEKILNNFKNWVADGSKDDKYSKSAYGTSKTFEIAYSRFFAEKNKDKIFVCHYCPGWVQTYMSNNGGFRKPVHGAKGLEIICQSDYKKLNTYSGKFFVCDYDKEQIPELLTAKITTIKFETGEHY